jgi:hypothetical protein
LITKAPIKGLGASGPKVLEPIQSKNQIPKILKRNKNTKEGNCIKKSRQTRAMSCKNFFISA